MLDRFRLSTTLPLLLLPAVFAASRLSAQTPANAQQIMTQTEATAKTTHKRILLDFGASWCGNCHLWDHFLADASIHPILDKYFVMLTLISGEHDGDTRHSNTPGALEYEDSVGGKGAGWPYIVILSPAGKPVVNNYRPDPAAESGRTNIGYPDAPEEVDWFMQMLKLSGAPLSAQETATIHTWLTAHGHSH